MGSLNVFLIILRWPNAHLCKKQKRNNTSIDFEKHIFAGLLRQTNSLCNYKSARGRVAAANMATETICWAAASRPDVIEHRKQLFARKQLPHVAVADGRHSDHGPPERVWDGFEKGFLGAGLGKINCAREQYYACGTTFILVSCWFSYKQYKWMPLQIWLILIQ
jgi:hypothetical protein